MMNFWVRADGQDQWEAVPHEGGNLTAGTYTIIARSPQPHFTITVDIHHLQPGDPSPTDRPTSGVSPSLQERRSIRTNDEGVGVILPATDLGAGVWEFHCHDADLIAELFGETRSDVLRLSIQGDAAEESISRDPEFLDEIASPEQPDQEDPQGAKPGSDDEDQDDDDQLDPFWGETDYLDAPQPSTSAAPVEPALPAPDLSQLSTLEPVSFSLLHNQLQGDPGEVVVLTGRIGGPGDMEARVYSAGEVVYESQRSIQFPPEARTAVFSLPIPLPVRPWQQDLVGTLMLHPANDQLPTSVTFTIARHTPPEPEPEVNPLLNPLAKASRNSLSDPLSSRSAQSAPLHLGRDAAPYLSALASETEAEGSPSPAETAPMPEDAPKIPDTSLFLSCESSPRSLKRLLRFLPPDAQPEANPAQDQELGAALTEPELVVKQPQPPEAELPLPPLSISMPTPGSPEIAEQIKQEEPDSSHPVPETAPEALSPPTIGDTTSLPAPADPVALPELRPKLEPPLATPLVEQPSMPAPARPQDPVVSASSPTSLPQPEVEVPLQIKAGSTLDIVLRLTCDSPPPWIKFRIRNGQNKSIADGPRWLMDYSQIDTNRWQTLTRLTIPHGIPELLFEAWTVGRDLKSEGSRIVVQRTVRE